ncbi:MAG: DUF3592 domain-containing protein [Pseudomonadota bacterium]
MGGYIKLVCGALLVLASVVGGLNMVMGGAQEAAQRIVDNGVDTTGVIEHRTKHTVSVRKGRIGGRGSYYSMTYSFVTAEGKKYASEINISEEDAYAVQDGQKITVRYNKAQPTINAALGFKDYFSQEDVENLPIGTMLFTTLLMILGGLYLCWSGWRSVGPSLGTISLGTGGSNHAVPQNRLDTLNRTGGAATFGRR